MTSSIQNRFATNWVCHKFVYHQFATNLWKMFWFSELYLDFGTKINKGLWTWIIKSIWSEVKSFSHVQLFATLWIAAWEWVTISFSRGSSWPRGQTQVSRIAGRCFNLWATGEAPMLSPLLRFSSVTHSCLTLSNPMNHSMPGLPVHHQLPEST